MVNRQQELISIASPDRTKVLKIGRRSIGKVQNGFVGEEEAKKLLTELYDRQIDHIEIQKNNKRLDPKFIRGGEILKDIRFKLRLTQKEFGDLLNVNHTTLSTWETGHARPPRLSVIGLKHILPAGISQNITVENFGYKTNKY